MGKREELCEHFGDGLLFADGFDSAIIGVCGGFDSGRVAYSVSKMVDMLFYDAGMPYEEAMEYLEFNTLGSYVGERTPIYIYDDEEEDE